MQTGLLRRVKYWYKMIPTSLTLGNSLCGFGAILYTLNAYAPEQGEEISELLAVSAWLIIGAMIFDMLDGWTARTLKAISPHGLQMDSLADMVTFGVAPAVVVAVMAHTNELAWLPYRWVWALCAVYLGCTALRLALYNVNVADEVTTVDFRGLPSPGAAAAVSSVVILYSHPGYEDSYILTAELLPFYAAVLGILMVSSIPYLHIGHWLGSKRKNKLKIFIVIIFFILFSWKSRIIAAFAINLYVLSGPIFLLVSRITGKVAADTAVPHDISSDMLVDIEE